MLIDTHCHVHFNAYKDDMDDVVRDCLSEGVQMVTIGTQKDTSANGIALAEKYDGVWATVGLHPSHIFAGYHDEGEVQFKSRNETFDPEYYGKLLQHPKVVAVGEMGLDYHYEHSPKELQQRFFSRYLHLATTARLPIIFHCREAFSDLFAIADAEYAGPAILHCFTGSIKEAEEVLKRGWYLSLSGIVTFKKSQELQEAARAVPDDRFLIETDCPFLAPEPFRGKRNEPAYVVKVAEKLAALRGSELTEIARLSTANTRRFFKLKLY